jgi:hypothetical protein
LAVARPIASIGSSESIAKEINPLDHEFSRIIRQQSGRNRNLEISLIEWDCSVSADDNGLGPVGARRSERRFAAPFPQARPTGRLDPKTADPEKQTAEISETLSQDLEEPVNDPPPSIDAIVPD